jgi:hypothetical protein
MATICAKSLYCDSEDGESERDRTGEDVAFQGSNLGMSRSRSLTISPAAAPTVVRMLMMAESLWRMASGVLAGTPSVWSARAALSSGVRLVQSRRPSSMAWKRPVRRSFAQMVRTMSGMHETRMRARREASLQRRTDSSRSSNHVMC